MTSKLRHNTNFFKFFCRLHGSYEALKYGSLLDGLADLTGGITESITIKQDITACSRLLHKLLDMTSIITATAQPPNYQMRAHTEKLASGIQIGTNYRVYAVERVSSSIFLTNFHNILISRWKNSAAKASKSSNSGTL